MVVPDFLVSWGRGYQFTPAVLIKSVALTFHLPPLASLAIGRGELGKPAPWISTHHHLHQRHNRLYTIFIKPWWLLTPRTRGSSPCIEVHHQQGAECPHFFIQSRLHQRKMPVLALLKAQSESHSTERPTGSCIITLACRRFAKCSPFDSALAMKSKHLHSDSRI